MLTEVDWVHFTLLVKGQLEQVRQGQVEVSRDRPNHVSLVHDTLCSPSLDRVTPIDVRDDGFPYV